MEKPRNGEDVYNDGERSCLQATARETGDRHATGLHAWGSFRTKAAIEVLLEIDEARNPL